MNAYDFDGTIYDGDSSIDFVLFCMRRHPRLLSHVPAIASAAARYKTGRIDKTTMKQTFFSYLRRLADPRSDVRAFWDSHMEKVKPWYLAQRRDDDLVISASPAFLLEEACARLGVSNLLASDVDIETGAFSGQNCRGAEKVRRFREAFPSTRVGDFYSDSVAADRPMAEIAERAWLVTGDRIEPWPAGSR